MTPNRELVDADEPVRLYEAANMGEVSLARGALRLLRGASALDFDDCLGTDAGGETDASLLILLPIATAATAALTNCFERFEAPVTVKENCFRVEPKWSKVGNGVRQAKGAHWPHGHGRQRDKCIPFTLAEENASTPLPSASRASC